MNRWVTDCTIAAVIRNVVGENGLATAKKTAIEHGDMATAWSIDIISAPNRPSVVVRALEAYSAAGGTHIFTDIPPPITDEQRYIAWRLLHPAFGACTRLNIQNATAIDAVKNALDKQFIQKRAELLEKLSVRLLTMATSSDQIGTTT